MPRHDYRPPISAKKGSQMMTRQMKTRHGGIIPLMVVILPVLLILIAFTVNLCYMELVRTEMQIATDAACKAAGRTLVATGSQQQAILEAQTAMSLNAIGGTHLSVDASDFEFGFSNRADAGSRYSFEVDSENVNAIRLRTDALMATAGSNLRFPLPLGIGNIQFRPMQDATASLAELDVCLVVDRSGSMAYGSSEVADGLVPPANAPPGWVFGQPVPPGSRWLDAVAAVEAFFGVLGETPQRERVCLSTYNHLPYYDVELTEDYNLIRSRLNQYSNAFEAGATNIGDGMTTGMSLLQNSPNHRDWSVRVMVVLTDGRHNWGTWPTYSAQSIASANVVVHTVTFALEADQALMAEVANIGGGRHYHATNEAELIEVFRDIARSLPVMLTD